jgi:hypothetical protein
MNSFLSLLSVRREMRDPIKPSGSGLESNPGPLKPESCVLSMRHSTADTDMFRSRKDSVKVEATYVWLTT